MPRKIKLYPFYDLIIMMKQSLGKRYLPQNNELDRNSNLALVFVPNNTYTNFRGVFSQQNKVKTPYNHIMSATASS